MIRNLGNMNYSNDNLAVDLQLTYGTYGNDAFEMFDTDGITTEQIGAALGKEVEDAYAEWIYLNIK